MRRAAPGRASPRRLPKSAEHGSIVIASSSDTTDKRRLGRLRTRARRIGISVAKLRGAKPDAFVLSYTHLDLPLGGCDPRGMSLDRAEQMIRVAEQGRGTRSARRRPAQRDAGSVRRG
ncbi:hypothetical protein M446_1278 [Methylobacterium sp. 4-46]|uniref:hypothetical protein n=1 Tax=unclassified Methylobacterium TaxID=2615210 RepID=UPI000165CA4C|nr:MULTISPECIES: hypothetical protein [Methylobacterium]ACA15798.1 hypothetical protein M446_1278 [Methylobacterium sp. 4-46]WFT81527.1 hypothetical protein QA634_06490 [Methylobacterium nodulans]